MTSWSNQNRAYIVRDKKAHFDWRWTPNTNGEDRLTLFQGKHGTFMISPDKPFSDSGETSNTLMKVQTLVTSITNQTHIEMYHAYSTKNSHNFGIRMDLEKELIETLKKLLIDVKISVQGTLDCGSVPEIPFHLAVELHPNRTIEDFDGASKLLQRYRIYSHATMSLMYTILFEWTDKKFTSISTNINVLERLFISKAFADCCIVAGNNVEVSCHKNILAVNSDVINTMLTTGLQETQTSRLYMTDISEEVVNKLLAYLYGLEIYEDDMEDATAFELLQTAHKYNVSPLEDLMMHSLQCWPVDSFDVNNVLPFYYFTKNVKKFQKLTEKMLDVLASKPRELVSSPVYQDLLKKNPEEAALWGLKLLDLVTN